VGGDAAVDYGKVMAVIARLQQAGISKVGLLTRPEGH
jgi:biopolymer transport protein TolR